MVAELEKGINWPWEGGTLTYQYLLVQICPNSPRLLESKKGTIPKFPWNHPSNWFTPNESLRITKSKSSRSQYFPPRIWFSEVFAPTKTRGIRGGFGLTRPPSDFPRLLPIPTSKWLCMMLGLDPTWLKKTPAEIQGRYPNKLPTF